MGKWFSYSMYFNQKDFPSLKEKMAWLMDRQLYQLSKGPGVYALYAKNKLIYIGSSSNISTRVVSHDWFWKSPLSPLEVKIRYTKKLGEWLMVEHRLIKRINPPCNHSTRNKKRIFEGYND